MDGDSDDCNTAQHLKNKAYGSISTPMKGLGVFFCTYLAKAAEVIGHA